MSVHNGASFEALKEQVSLFPDEPGVYLFKNSVGGVLYVGKANSLKRRVSSYFQSSGQAQVKVRTLVARTQSVEFILTDNEKQALLLESNLIKKYRPRYNIVLRDDKSYPYLRVTLKEPFPRVLMSRRPSDDGSVYFGPYPNLKVRELLKVVYRFFKIRDCDIYIDGKSPRACLSYQIKQCPAPCIGAIDRDHYRQLVEKVLWFLEGKHDELEEYVRNEMLRASEKLEFEEAANFRDLLTTIEKMTSGASMIVPEKMDLDVLALAAGLDKIFVSIVQVRQGRVTDHLKMTLENEMDHSVEDALGAFLFQYYQPGVQIPREILVGKGLAIDDETMRWMKEVHGPGIRFVQPSDDWHENLMSMAEKNVMTVVKDDVNKTNLLKELGNLLGLTKIPREIACFDISTLQGSFTVGSAVLFKDGIPEKSRYRKFKIKEVEGQDDYRSHQEMMARYLRLLEREGNLFPDLFLIDGGKGQLQAVKIVLDHELGEGYGLASLAKREEEVFLPGQGSPVDFSKNLKARHLLQRVRDESHRFAVGYHRDLRDRNLLVSVLQKVKGIGPTRVRSLLGQFGSIQGIQKAAVDELATVPGLTRELSQKLFDFLHSQGSQST
jgi:excinuclease ABC subunit C